MSARARPGEIDTRPRLRLCLYLAGGSPNSAVALANLRDALEHRPAHLVDLEVVDVLQVPERGPRDGVLLTPMLVRLEPLPERRLLGSLSDRALLLATLGSSEPLHG